jgi:hypothetical protein
MHPGLCASCRHARTIESRRGSRFWLCSLSQSDPRFPRYPPLPVVSCVGYTPVDVGASETRSEATDPGSAAPEPRSGAPESGSSAPEPRSSATGPPATPPEDGGSLD